MQLWPYKNEVADIRYVVDWHVLLIINKETKFSWSITYSKWEIDKSMKHDPSQWTVKLRSRIKDIWQTDMYS